MFNLLLFLIPFSIPFFNLGNFSFFGNNAAQTPGSAQSATESGNVIPIISCVPRPWCLDHAPFCYKYLGKPSVGWCPPTTVSPYPSIQPGCHYEHRTCPMILCQAGQPCPTCSPEPIIICPSGTPTPPEFHMQLSCKECGFHQLDKLCFSASQQRAYCRNSEVMMPDPADVVCVTCTSVIPSVYPTFFPNQTVFPSSPCYPRPACLDMNPACPIPEPKGGWCHQSVNSSQSQPVGSGIPITIMPMVHPESGDQNPH